MPVVVPSAPEVQETTRMLEDSESVSSLGHQLSQDVKGHVPGAECPGGPDILCWPRDVKQSHHLADTH